MHPEILETIVKMEVNRLNFAVRGGRDFSKELLQAELAKGKASLSQKAKINPNLQLPGRKLQSWLGKGSSCTQIWCLYRGLIGLGCLSADPVWPQSCSIFRKSLQCQKSEVQIHRGSPAAPLRWGPHAESPLSESSAGTEPGISSHKPVHFKLKGQGH